MRKRKEQDGKCSKNKLHHTVILFNTRKSGRRFHWTSGFCFPVLPFGLTKRDLLSFKFPLNVFTEPVENHLQHQDDFPNLLWLNYRR